jgi:hypothetical protein
LGSASNRTNSVAGDSASAEARKGRIVLKRKLVWLTGGLAMVGFMVAPQVQAGSNTDRATGGGQVLVGTRGGAGDTIAFQAHNDAATGIAATGQLQYVNRTATGQTVFHGLIECMRVTMNGTVAKIAGHWNAKSGGGIFELLVTDNGQGNAAPDDMISLDETGTSVECDTDNSDDDDFNTALARGNVQIYDNGSAT